MVKKLLRAFRASLKRQFNELSGKKHYHWVDTSLRIITLQFFTALSEQNIPVEFYKENEEAFFKLVHNTWDNKTSKKSKKTYDGGDMKRMAITGVYKEVFGQHPNKKNLKRFFESEVIQTLWVGNFRNSREYKKWKTYLQTFPLDQQKKLDKYMVSIEKEARFSVI